MWTLLFNFLGSGACVRATVLALCLGFAGCQVPQWRVGQAKVPEPLQKPAIQVEAERQSADWLAKTVSAPPEAIPVAQKLAASLGEPEHPIAAKTAGEGRDEALEVLADGVRAQQAELSKLNAKLSKYDGSKIEGTGFNMFGLSMSLPVIGFILLVVFCPSSLGVMWWLLKKSRGALVAMVKGVQDFKDSQPVPEIVQELHTSLSKQMDASHKKLVRKIKSTQI